MFTLSVCISGLIRIPLLHELDPIDETWTIVPPGLWINVEANIGLLSACLPVMRPLFKSSTRFFSSRSKSKSLSTSGKQERESSKESALSSASTKYGSEGGGNDNRKGEVETRTAYIGTEAAPPQKPKCTYRGSVEQYPHSTPPPPPAAQQVPPRNQPSQVRHQKSWYGRPRHRQFGNDGWSPPWDEREVQRRETGRIEAILPPGVLDLRDRARRWGREASF